MESDLTQPEGLHDSKPTEGHAEPQSECQTAQYRPHADRHSDGQANRRAALRPCCRYGKKVTSTSQYLQPETLMYAA